ncbi:MAG: DNA mismatch repair protein MutT [Paracoccaceae bacterium]
MVSAGSPRVSEGEVIRAAATVILWRGGPGGPEVLMGQRGAQAVFMPSKYVFPGGGVDPGDDGPLGMLSDRCRARLTAYCPPDAPIPAALVGTTIRELAEETGLVLEGADSLRFVFRAITPPGRTRRFDARFFLASATAIQGDLDDFSHASDELGHLHWIGLTEAGVLDLPFITEVVLAEVTSLLSGTDQPGVPFFDNSGATPTFRRIS